MEGSSINQKSKSGLINGDFCIFCVRKVSANKAGFGSSHILSSSFAWGDSPRDYLLVVPKAVVGPKFIGVLNLVWPHIQAKGEGEEENGENISFADVIRGNWKCSGMSSGQRTTPFSEVPTLCQICADKVQQVDDFMESVKSQVEVLRNLITQSRKGGEHSWREGRYHWALEEAQASGAGTSGNLQAATTVKNPVVPKEPELASGSRSLPGKEKGDKSVNSGIASYDVSPKSPVSDCASVISDDQTDRGGLNNEVELIDLGSSDTEALPSEYGEGDDEYESEQDSLLDGQGKNSRNQVGRKISLGGPSRVASKPIERNLLKLKRKALEFKDPQQGTSSRTHNLPEKYPVGGSFRENKVMQAFTAHRKKEYPATSAIFRFRCSCGEAFTTKERQLHHFRTSPKHARNKI